MAVTKLPLNQSLPQFFVCVICNRCITPAQATAGCADADGQLTFACNGHFWSAPQFILGWAAFSAALDQEFRRRGLEVRYA